MNSCGVTTSTSITGSSSSGAALLASFLERHRARDLERELRRIDFVILAVEQRGLDIHHRISGEHPVFHRLFDAVLDRADELARNGAALGAVDEFESAALAERLDPEIDHAELAMAAGLAHETSLGLGGLANRFAIRDLRLADVRIDLELAQQAVDDDFEMQLAHPGDQRLRSFPVDADAERRIFFRELLQRLAELLLIGLGLGLDRDLDDRIGELDSFQHDRLGRIA